MHDILVSIGIGVSISSKLNSFSFLDILSPTSIVDFLIHSELNVAFAVSAFLYTSVIGTISTIFSIKFSDTFS